MATPFTHAMAAVALGTMFTTKQITPRFWIAGALCAVLPDIDAIGRPFGWGDIAVLGGHRAFTHSIFFAAILGLIVTLIAFRGKQWDGQRTRVVVYLALATASHGVLDAFTNVPPGVEFFSPFSVHRYTAPWRPITGAFTEFALGFLLLFLIAIAVDTLRGGIVRRAIDPDIPPEASG